MTIPLQHQPHRLLTASTTHQTKQNPHLIQNTHVESDPLQSINGFKKLLIQHRGFTKFDFPPALKACSKAAALSPGKQIHALYIKCCLSTDIYTQTSLLSMYSACGELDDAMRLFEKMPKRNVVSWTAMIKAFLHCDQPEMALAAFREMQMAGIKLDDFTVVNVLSACARLGVLNLGRWVHAYVSRGGFKFDYPRPLPTQSSYFPLNPIHPKIGNRKLDDALFKGSNNSCLFSPEHLASSRSITLSL